MTPPTAAPRQQMTPKTKSPQTSKSSKFQFVTQRPPTKIFIKDHHGININRNKLMKILKEHKKANSDIPSQHTFGKYIDMRLVNDDGKIAVNLILPLEKMKIIGPIEVDLSREEHIYKEQIDKENNPTYVPIESNIDLIVKKMHRYKRKYSTQLQNALSIKRQIR